jgi:hypothetical protein
MGKADRILDFFPACYRTVDRAKLLATVVGRLAQPLDECDAHLFRIQRAHRLKVAEHVVDIMRLAGIMNLTSFHFEDIVDDQSLGYADKLTLMRDRVQRIANLHLQGLGTPWAILEGTAIFLRGTIVPQDDQSPLISHVDDDRYSHKAILEFANVAGNPRAQVFLHENPIRRKKVELAERWQRNSWQVQNNGANKVGGRFIVTGVDDHTVMPSVYCPQTEEGLLFYGLVPAGQTLVIDPATGATLDDEPVDAWLISFKGAMGDSNKYNTSSYAVDRVSPSEPFGGDTERSAARLFQRKTISATVPVGQTEWHYKVADGVYDGSMADFCVYETENAPIGIYDQDFSYGGSVYEYASAGMVGMSWDERAACAFKVVLPNHLPNVEGSGPKEGKANTMPQDITSAANHASRIANILPRFKPAGVRAYVDVAKDGWVLGESLLRNSRAANGEGIAFHSTRLLRDDADMLLLEI